MSEIIKSLRQRLTRFCRNDKERVFIFGTGQAGQSAYRNIKSTSHVRGFIDNDTKKHGNKLYGKTIYSPERLNTRDYTQILIASMYSGEIMVQLVKTMNVPPDTIRISSWHFQERSSLLKRMYPAALEYKRAKSCDPHFRRACYAAERYEKRPLREDHILYESSNDHGFPCNPYALLECLLNHPDVQEMVHVVAVRDTTREKSDPFRAHSRVRIVEVDSDEYIEYAQTCKYFIHDVSLAPYIIKRKGQIFVTTWHDTLQRKPDHDIGRIWETKETARALLVSDYFISPNEVAARNIFKEHRIDRIFQGKVITIRRPGKDADNACRRIIDIIFKGAEGEDVIHYTDDRMKRVNLLMYPGALHPNGVTTAFLAMLGGINYERYNVTVLLPNDDTGRDYQRLIHPNATVLYDTLPFGYTPAEFKKKRKMEVSGLRHTGRVPVTAFRRNMRRILPDLAFDVVIDFNGYMPEPAATLCFGVEAGKRVIYMHNNLYRDMTIKHPQLHAVFSLYPHFDRILCVSAESLRENIEGAGAYIQKQFGCDISGKMDFTHNMIDPEAIMERARDKPVFREGETLMYRVDNTINAGHDDRYTFNIPAPVKDHVNFITIGRLSPEKNHLRMLKALRLLADQHANVRLYLVGQGPLKDELEKAVRQYGLTQSVVFVYHMSNPFPLLDMCDCFLLSSDIEGQPVTVLEALALGKHVISTDIPGTRSMLKNGQGILVPLDAEALAEAMRAFVESSDNARTKRFDTAQYVRDAIVMYEEKVFTVG